ncbi:MAG TPA: M14 family zinc carboxypeptidase [Candidatus Krumholzibacteria bacterium]|nr:M14 family zinc carboxypeptidase [Candidatus Krumholzibacteria bacterium]HRX50515.1 M14 family zinc carboxypeptidase [Candidatus Krumholzibacteria bacterium]
MSLAQRAGVLTVALLLFCCAAVAAPVDVPVDAAGRPVFVPKTWDDAPVRLTLTDRDALSDLLRAVPLSRFSREDIRFGTGGEKFGGLVLDVRVTPAELASLRAAGYAPEALPDLHRQGREEAERVWLDRAAKSETAVFPLTYYPSHAEIGTILADMAAAHPTLARTFQFGSSVQGRELWGLVISDDVQNTEAEPEVRYSSSIHGDETVGIVLTLNFADYLLSNYGQPGYEEVTNLVDNYEIHLMPLHNPDGYVLDQRYNANGVDLNRNYPEPDGTHATQEIETLNMMAYINGSHSVLSLNYHGGALVANYLWDWTYTRAPDDAALIPLCLEYSTENLPMYNGSFSQGITNGADWYVATGTLQDWAYETNGDLNTTLEVSNTKWPSAGTLTTFWNENRQAMMEYAKAARYGVNGVVTGADTGLPLDATITVVGNAKPVHTDPAHGDYYKLLPTGTYDLVVSAVGYLDQNLLGVSTTWGTPTVLNVALQPLATGAVSGHVEAAGGLPLPARVDAYTYPLHVLTATTYANAAGDFTLPGIYYGDYTLEYRLDGYVSGSQQILLDGAALTVPDMVLEASQEITAFQSDFDAGDTSGWTISGGWGVVSPGADGTAYAVNDSPSGSYPSNASLACAMTAGADLSAVFEGTLSYRAKWDIETNWDGCQLQVSVGGGAWSPVATAHTQSGSGQGVQSAGQPYYEGSQAAWITETVDLDPWLGEADVRFRFLLQTDTSIVKDGFTFDTFLIHGLGVVTSDTSDTPQAFTRLQGLRPNPFNPSTTVSYELAAAGRAVLEVYDVQGRLVRTLLDETRPAGAGTALWDGRADDGSAAASGMYFVRLRSGGESRSLKAMLVK